MSHSNQRLEAKIYGRVQGVGFRVFVRDKALALGVSGYAKNRDAPRRHVEVVAEGPKPALQTLLRFLEEGPSLARVERVDVQWGSATGEFSGFSVG
jgi:acylphosphatase